MNRKVTKYKVINVLIVDGGSQKCKLQPFHGGNSGSNPLGDAKQIKPAFCGLFYIFAILEG